VYATVRTGWGEHPIRLVAPRRLVRVYRVDRPLTVRIVAPGAASLPVRRGDALGELRVWNGARLLASSSLVAAAGAKRPGFLGRVGFYARRSLHDAWRWVP
jgi:hypothetical protein